MPGEQKKIRLTLKYLADIGIIGLPNAGKSTLLSRLTSASPKIGNYAFTTLIPNLGVMVFEDEVSLTLADIPGLIEGASMGRGLGHHFLKHIERTRVLLHVIDITYEPEKDLLEDYFTLQMEMERYDPHLLEKDHLVLINKMDLAAGAQRDVGALRKAFHKLGVKSIPVSALTGEGLEELKGVLEDLFFQGKSTGLKKNDFKEGTHSAR
jgi:GTP-binding protein